MKCYYIIIDSIILNSGNNTNLIRPIIQYTMNCFISKNWFKLIKKYSSRSYSYQMKSSKFSLKSVLNNNLSSKIIVLY